MALQKGLQMPLALDHAKRDTSAQWAPYRPRRLSAVLIEVSVALAKRFQMDPLRRIFEQAKCDARWSMVLAAAIIDRLCTILEMDGRQ